MTATSPRPSARTRTLRRRPARRPARRTGSEKSGNAFIYFIVAVVAAVLLLNLFLSGDETEENTSDQATDGQETLTEPAGSANSQTGEAGTAGQPDDADNETPVDDGGTTTPDDATIQPADDAEPSGAGVTGDTGSEQSAAAAAPFTIANTTQPAITSQGEVTVYEYSASDAVSVMPANQVESIRHSYEPVSESAITISGQPAQEIVGLSPRDGSHTRYLLIPFDGQLLFVRGSDQFLDQVKSGLTIP